MGLFETSIAQGLGNTGQAELLGWAMILIALGGLLRYAGLLKSFGVAIFIVVVGSPLLSNWQPGPGEVASEFSIGFWLIGNAVLLLVAWLKKTV